MEISVERDLVQGKCLERPINRSWIFLRKKEVEEFGSFASADSGSCKRHPQKKTMGGVSLCRGSELLKT